VSPGSTGGDGSVERPLGTIAEAIANGARKVALGPGEHALPPYVQGITLAGTCPTLTTLRADYPTVVAGESTLRRLRVTGTGQLNVPPAARLSLEAVEIEGMPRAVELEGALVARGAAIHDISGEAITAFDAASIELENVTLERIRSDALWLGNVSVPRAHVSLTDVVIAAVGSTALQDAIILDGVASLTVERLVLEEASGHGLLVRADTAKLDDLFLRQLGGAALLVDGGRAELEQIRVADAAAGVVLAVGEHHARDLAITDTEQIALLAIDARGDAERVLVQRAGITGVNVDGSAFAVRDLVVAEVEGVNAVTGGAFLAENAAVATLERALLERSEHYGLGVTGAELSASDVEVRDVRPRSGTDGYGIVALDGSVLTLARASIHDVFKVGLTVQDATATTDDVVVERVLTPDDLDGVGVAIVGESTATMRNTSIADAVRWGVIVSGPRARLDASDLHVRRTQEAPCAPADCRGAQGGAAIVAHDRATGHVTRFRARGSAHAGVIATSGVDLRLEQGRVEENRFGLVVSADLPINPPSGRGLALMGVELVDNDVDHQQTELDVRPPEIDF
jgi:hypothetical protein